MFQISLLFLQSYIDVIIQASVSKFEYQFRNPRERFGCAVIDPL